MDASRRKPKPMVLDHTRSTTLKRIVSSAIARSDAGMLDNQLVKAVIRRNPQGSLALIGVCSALEKREEPFEPLSKEFSYAVNTGDLSIIQIMRSMLREDARVIVDAVKEGIAARKEEEKRVARLASAKAYTNEELANAYFDVATENNTAGDFGWYKYQAGFIRAAEGNISSFHKQSGSLKELRMKGIGKKTVVILDMILEKGVDGAKEQMKQMTEQEFRRYQFSGIPRLIRKMQNGAFQHSVSHNTGSGQAKG
jgi:hypothetical protein